MADGRLWPARRASAQVDRLDRRRLPHRPGVAQRVETLGPLTTPLRYKFDDRPVAHVAHPPDLARDLVEPVFRQFVRDPEGVGIGTALGIEELLADSNSSTAVLTWSWPTMKSRALLPLFTRCALVQIGRAPPTPRMA